MTMDLNKWLSVYNSILRLKFYSYLESKGKTKIIKEFDSEYQDFINHNGLNPKNEKVRFFGGDFLLGLSYLILVRTNEFLSQEFTTVEKQIITDIKNWNIFGLENFNDILSFYNIELITLLEHKNDGVPNYTNDSEKLSFFVSNIRHALSHYNFKDTESSTMKLWNNHNNILKMECQMPKSSILNFSGDFGIAVDIGLKKFVNNN